MTFTVHANKYSISAMCVHTNREYNSQTGYESGIWNRQ